MRLNTVGTIIGQRGSGKTLFLLGSQLSANPKDADLNVPGLIGSEMKAGMQKVLIVDTLDHPSYRKIPILPPRDWRLFKKGMIRRCLIKPAEAPDFFTLISDSPHLNNTFIVCEDAVKYAGKHRLVREVENVIVDSKQRNIDMVFMYHCFVDTPGDIFTKMDWLHLFKTEDTPEVRKGKLRLFDKVHTVWREVNAHPSKFYGKFIDTRTQ